MQIIDSHQHFWIYDPLKHGWIDESMKIIQKDFTPSIFQKLLAQNSVEGSIAVQVDQTEEETYLLIEEAKQNAFIKGVVGWIDLNDENIVEKLVELSAYKQYLKGFRHILQAEPVEFMLQDSFINGLNALSKHGFTYDLLIKHDQLPAAIKLVKQLPNLPIVLDHIAKPDIKNNEIEKWAQDIKEFSNHPNVNCKISGMVTEANWQNWNVNELYQYLDIVFDCFGPDRIMFGSDWPVCLVASSYEKWLETVQIYMQQFNSADQQKVFADNCVQFYNLP